ncbi:fibronectin type III domain-containing protein, partial [Hymenobacter terrenus]|uniref:fibronectin type III domain-containing protein n=1 Tax=Hymenobacter terrenus TaxID=1629124 RepID=UPI0018CFD585
MNKLLPMPLLKFSWRFGGALLALTFFLMGLTAQAQVNTYSFVSSSGTFTPLPATATNVPDVLADDDISGVLPIGFTFVFDGTPYTSFIASSNGFISFNPNATDESFNELESGIAVQRPLVAPLWDDIANSTSSRASYQVTGTAPTRVLTFEWLNWRWSYSATGPVISFQVKLYEGSNRVEFVYRPEANPPLNADASIGLSGVGSGIDSFLSVSDGVANPVVSSVSSNDDIAQSPAAGQVYAFTPPVPSLCPTPRNLTASVSGVTATVNWTIVGGGNFTVIYGPTGFNPATSGTSVGPVATTTATIPNLAPGNYQFYVRQNCAGAAGSSPLSSAGGFSVTCPTPTALAATNLTNTTATLEWNSPVTAGATFTIIYGALGIDPATEGTRLTGINATTYTLTNLSAATNYVFYVVQACSDGSTSTTPAGPVSFTTPLTVPSNDEPCGALAL